MSELWFYCPDLGQIETLAELTGVEARHATARRLRAGDRLILFDGQGLCARATVAALNNRSLNVHIDERWREAPTPLMHMCVAIPKGERITTLLDMATQLGMTDFTPLVCEHSVVAPSTASSERWRRITIEACKQSRRAELPRIHQPCTLIEAVQQARARSTEEIWFAHPSSNAVPAGMLKPPISSGIVLVIGPEGGFSNTEANDLKALGAHAVGLGPGILRIETAAIALLATLVTKQPTRT